MDSPVSQTMGSLALRMVVRIWKCDVTIGYFAKRCRARILYVEICHLRLFVLKSKIIQIQKNDFTLCRKIENPACCFEVKKQFFYDFHGIM